MPILDAKRDQVFAAIYHRDGHSLDELAPAQLTSLTDLLSRAPKPLLVLGEGIRYHAQHLFTQPGPDGAAEPCPFEDRESSIGNLTVAPESAWYPKASTIAHLGLRLKEQGAYADVFKLTPLYIRKPEARAHGSGPPQAPRIGR